MHVQSRKCCHFSSYLTPDNTVHPNVRYCITHAVKQCYYMLVTLKQLQITVSGRKIQLVRKKKGNMVSKNARKEVISVLSRYKT
jgi:hypothetical protein